MSNPDNKIQIGYLILIFLLIFPLGADLHTCGNDCLLPGICDCRETCIGSSGCYFNLSWPLECIIEGFPPKCVCTYQDKEDNSEKEDCDNYFRIEGLTCHYSAVDKCTSSGWDCETTQESFLGDCCLCTAAGPISGSDSFCPLRYCGGPGDLCACYGCNLNQVGDQTLDFDCQLSGTHYLQTGTLTIDVGGSIVMLAGSTFKFDNGYSIIMKEGYILMSKHSVKIEKQY